MVDMAGFDVVIQLSREVVSDAASVTLAPAPGETAYLFGGPFRLTQQLVDWPDPVVVSGALEATLAPQIGDADIARIFVTLSEVFLAGMPALDALGALDGSGEVIVPLRFGYLPGLNDVGYWPIDKAEREAGGETFPPQFAVGLFVDTGAASVGFAFGSSRPAIAQALGLDGASAIESAISTAIEFALGTVVPAPQPIALASLRVRTTVDSTEFDTLAAWPILRWISPGTLACFGNYRAGPTSSDPARKDGRSDIDSRQRAFVYPTSSATGMSAVPAAPVSLSISIAALQRRALCPAVREHLARAAAAAQVAPTKKREILDGTHPLSPAERAVYWETYTAALEVSPPDEAYAEAAAAAARVAAMAHLDTAPGIPLVAASTPPPCGGGAAEFALDVPMWPDGTATVTRVVLRGEEGRLVVVLKVRVRVPPGGVDATIDVPARLQVAAGARDLVAHVDDPVVTRDDTTGEGIVGAVLGILSLPFGGVGWGFLVGALSTVLVEGIVGIVAPKVIASKVGGAVSGEQATAAASDPRGLARLDDVDVDADAVTVFGLVGRSIGRWNDLRETVALRVEQVSREVDPDLPLERGSFRKDRSCQDDAPREFGYTVRPWREVWRAHVVSRNVVGPLRVVSAQVRIGDLGSRSISERGLLEPRWREPWPLVAPFTSVPGPITVLELPERTRTVPEVLLGVERSDDLEWEVTTRGADGCIGIRLDLTLADARERRHEAVGFFFPVGLEVEWDPGMEEEMSACAARLHRELEGATPFEERADLPPWAEVWDPAGWAARGDLVRALRDRDVAALSRRSIAEIVRAGSVGRIR
ncbi:hypothetical protein [Microbacterium sp. RU33B]|uniref:hypothetical protein n=1 Tax=Microbacterium sp. RU33B TaxID=1907390 RepID=UPI00095CCB72|nr:hypothetical protein [Microbacterium sp. RU33B]SIT87751.1 hypothetical protein SAMN05880545_2854 [Microbacterium sp. RU33B]